MVFVMLPFSLACVTGALSILERTYFKRHGTLGSSIKESGDIYLLLPGTYISTSH